jgi:glycosyltransferase involved in cell wall biosynthesis
MAGEIGDTCGSVAGQTFADFEWLVIDGGSGDGTLAILEKYRSRMARLISEPDRGVYHAMNKGIDLAGGEYLLFLNGGDYLASERTLERVFAGDPQADVLYGDELHWHPEDGRIEVRVTPGAGEMGKLYFAYGSLNHQAAFIRRTLFDRFGRYDEGYPLAADREKWVVFAENGCSFTKLDFGVSVYRLNGMSSLEANAGRLEEAIRKIRKRHFSPGELRESLRLRRWLRGYAKTWWWGGNERFSLFSRGQTRLGIDKRKYYFLNLPVLKIKAIGRRRLFSLFGLMPVWKSRTE